MIAKDKVLHVIAGVLTYLTGYLVVGTWAILLVVVVAVGKEVYDSYNKEEHTPEVLDAIATVLGGTVCWVITHWV